MLAVLGDLIEDLVVVLDGPIQLASDTDSTIERRRGGSAANVVATAGALGHRTRFLGQVGDDAIGNALVAELTTSGCDTQFVRRGGATGTIIVLVDADGERSMLTDRKSCSSLGHPEDAWLDGVDTLHVPLYSFAGGALATTARTIVGWAHQRGIAVTLDASSVSLIDDMGADHVRALVAELRPDVLFANDAEAQALDLDGIALAPITVIKRGAEPALLRGPDASVIEVPAIPLGQIRDATAAGDAFAAGFLTTPWRDDPIAACNAGHAAAAAVLQAR